MKIDPMVPVKVIGMMVRARGRQATGRRSAADRTPGADVESYNEGFPSRRESVSW
jgi:hypothetical protein